MYPQRPDTERRQGRMEEVAATCGAGQKERACTRHPLAHAAVPSFPTCSSADCRQASHPVNHALSVACGAVCATSRVKATHGSGTGQWVVGGAAACKRPCPPCLGRWGAAMQAAEECHCPCPNSPALLVGGNDAGWWVAAFCPWPPTCTPQGLSKYPQAYTYPHLTTPGIYHYVDAYRSDNCTARFLLKWKKWRELRAEPSKKKKGEMYVF